MTFAALASLLMPADPGRRGKVIEVGPGWDVETTLEHQGADVVVWGREALPSGSELRAVIRFARARRKSLRRLARHPPASLPLVSIHALPPPLIRVTPVRSKLRAAMLGGAAVRLSVRDPGPNILDEVASAAGAERAPAVFEPGAGGSALLRLPLSTGGHGYLKASATGGPGDPSRAAEALQLLAGRHLVPALLGRGSTAGASWTLESGLPGRRPRRLTRRLVVEVAKLCAGLPGAETGPSAHRADIATLAAHFPDWQASLSGLSDRLDEELARLPSLMRHGDVWTGNLLVLRGGLSGVLDWDAWHPASSPGLDLFHLLATHLGQTRRLPLGQVFLGRPWRTDRFARPIDGYWRSLKLTPSPSQLDAIGLSWWSCQAANSVRRAPELALDESWVSENIEAVLSDG